MMLEGEKEIVLSGVHYVPGFYVKLFSLTSAMKNGAKLISEGMKLTVKNSPVKLKFKKCLKTKNSFVLGLELKPKMSKFAGLTGKNKKV